MALNNKNIKICALTTISKTMDWFVVDSMRNLAKNGYMVTLVCNMEEGFADRNSDYATCVNLPMSRGVSVKDFFWCTIYLLKYFKKEKFDIIYYTSPNVSLYASLAGLLTGIKVRFYSQCGLRYVSFEGLKRKVFWLVEKITCDLSTTIRAQSPMNMQFAIDEKLCNKEKISVVGIGGTTGVDLSQCDAFDHKIMRNELRKRWSIPENAFVYGYVGRINRDKGINELIKAFQMLQSEINNIYLVLVGMIDNTNPIDESNLKYARENPQIVLTGNVSRDQVYPHMTIFDVLVHPTYREGFGKVLQEAMGVGIPIITTNVPGPSEVVENNVSGLLAEVRNAEDLAEKMKTLYYRDDLRKSLAEQGRKRAETYFDRPIMLNNILKDLDKTMGRERENEHAV